MADFTESDLHDTSGCVHQRLDEVINEVGAWWTAARVNSLRTALEAKAGKSLTLRQVRAILRRWCNRVEPLES